MSRWAELFDALSEGHDTLDTLRHFGVDAPECHKVSKVSEGENNPTLTSAYAQGARAEVEQDDISFLGDVLEERAAIIEYDAGVPREWAEGYAALSTMPRPDGFMPDRWQRIIDAAGYFLDHWAVHAAECGWSATDVFGCHATRPDARFDAMGLLLTLDRHCIVAIDQTGADLLTTNGSTLRFYRRPLPAQTVALWDLVRESAA